MHVGTGVKVEPLDDDAKKDRVQGLHDRIRHRGEAQRQCAAQNDVVRVVRDGAWSRSKGKQQEGDEVEGKKGHKQSPPNLFPQGLAKRQGEDRPDKTTQNREARRGVVGVAGDGKLKKRDMPEENVHAGRGCHERPIPSAHGAHQSVPDQGVHDEVGKEKGMDEFRKIFLLVEDVAHRARDVVLDLSLKDAEAILIVVGGHGDKRGSLRPLAQQIDNGDADKVPEHIY